MVRTKTTTGANAIRLGRRFSSPEGWIGRYPRDVWPELIGTDPSGFTLRRWINPQRPLPRLSIVLVFGDNSTRTAASLANRFAHDFSYNHIDVGTYLRSLRSNMRRAIQEKLFGDLHPNAFASSMDKNQFPIAGFLIDILKRTFEMEGRRDPTKARKWVISGLDVRTDLISKFCHMICVPDATVFISPPDVHEDPRMVELHNEFVAVKQQPVWLEEYEKDAYAALLSGITNRALSGGLRVPSGTGSHHQQINAAPEYAMGIDEQNGSGGAIEPSGTTADSQTMDDASENEAGMEVQISSARDTPMEDE